MALSLGVGVGDCIQIGNGILRVVKVVSRAKILIDYSGTSIMLNAEERSELAPGVLAYCGVAPGSKSTVPRIAIEAPREIRVERIHKGNDEA